MKIEAENMLPREVVLSVVTPRPYEDPLSVEARAAEALNESRNLSVDSTVITATNQLIEARKAAPGGELHQGVMADLVKMLADTPGAIDSLKALQNGNAK